MANLDFQRYFFEIGIYSHSPEIFYQQQQEGLEQHLAWLTQKSGGLTREEVPDSFARSEEDFLRRYGGWRYTQAIGWIRLYILGTQIRGEIWIVTAKKISLFMNKKKFEHYGKAFEISIYKNKSSIEIYNEINSILIVISKEEPFKGHYIDLEAFRNIGPFINWHELLGIN